MAAEMPPLLYIVCCMYFYIMEAVVIGSYAASCYLVRTPIPSDYDLITHRDDFDAFIKNRESQIDYLCHYRVGRAICKFNNGINIDFELFDDNSTSSSKAIYDFCLRHGTFGAMVNYCFPDISMILPPVSILYYIKKSHITKSINWLKHIEDYHDLKPVCDAAFDGICVYYDDVMKIYQQRKEEHDVIYARRPANLNMSNERFFEKSQRQVKRQFIHDSLHEAVKYGIKPMFAYIKKDADRASVSKKLFDDLSTVSKDALVREESYVIALERYIIPLFYDDIMNGGGIDDALSIVYYRKAICDVCTKLSSGWFSDYIVDSWNHVKYPDVDFVKLFVNGVASGVVKTCI